MNSFLHGGEAVSGKEGKVYVIIDGAMYDFAMAKNISCTVEKNKSDVKAIGHRFTMHKTGGVNGKGSMDIYDCIPQFRAMAAKYVAQGVDVYFKIITVNEDPGSSSGTQRVAYNYVNLDSTVISQLNADTDALETTIDFTFEDFTILTPFES